MLTLRTAALVTSALVALAVAPLTARAASLCTPAPAVCRAPAVGEKALIRLRRGLSCEHNRLLWKWLYGAATEKAEFGDPTGSTDFSLCIYDASGLLFEAEIPGGCPGWARCWTEKRNGFQYRNKQDQYLETQQFPPDGIRRAFVKAGDDRKAAILVQGKGCLILRDSPLEDGVDGLLSPVTVQLQKSGGGCWGAVYSFPRAMKHDDLEFKDRAD